MMEKSTVYYIGGFDPSAPAENKAEEYDDTALTYTAWDEAGKVTATRPYTDAEKAASAPPPPDPLAAAKAVLRAQADPAQPNPTQADLLTALAQVALDNA